MLNICDSLYNISIQCIIARFPVMADINKKAGLKYKDYKDRREKFTCLKMKDCVRLILIYAVKLTETKERNHMSCVYSTLFTRRKMYTCILKSAHAKSYETEAKTLHF